MTAGTAFLVLSPIFALSVAVSWVLGKAAVDQPLALPLLFAAAFLCGLPVRLILHDLLHLCYE